MVHDTSRVENNAFFEDLLVRLESDDRSMKLRRADLFYCSLAFALRIFLHVYAAVLMHDRFYVNGQCVHHGCTHAVKSAGNFVSFSAKFASGMENSHDCFERGNFCLFVNVHGNTAAVIYDSYAVVREECDLDVIGKAAHGFIAGVVEYLCNEVVETVRACCTDVHAGALTDRLKTFHNGDGRSIVTAGSFSFFDLIFLGIFCHI